MYGVGIYDHDITFGPEGAQSQLDVGKGVASHTSLAVVVLHARGHKFGCVGIHRDVAEVYVAELYVAELHAVAAVFIGSLIEHTQL